MAVTLRVRCGLFLLSPFTVLAATPIVRSGKSNVDSSTLQDKHKHFLSINNTLGRIVILTYNNGSEVSAAGPFLNCLKGEFLSVSAHLGRLLAMLESAEAG